MKQNITCAGICGKTKTEFDKKDGVCKERRKEIARRGLLECTEGWGEFKPISEFVEPGLCKECKNILENSFDYYCDKDHCRELDIKEILMLLHSFSDETHYDYLKSDGSCANDAKITHLIRDLMVFILYRMNFKDNPMD